MVSWTLLVFKGPVDCDSGCNSGFWSLKAVAHPSSQHVSFPSADSVQLEVKRIEPDRSTQSNRPPRVGVGMVSWQGPHEA